MQNIRDLYPSRTETKLEMFPRLDPVLHRDNNQRSWSGPLTDRELATFEREGFLFIESLLCESDILTLSKELHRLAATSNRQKPRVSS